MEEKRYPAEKSAEIQKLLDTATLFVGLPPETLDKVTSHAVTRTHPANRAILLENDWGGSVYFILDGWVKIRTYDRSGKEVTLNIVGKGEIVGEMAALDKSTRSSDAITLTTATISSIPAQSGNPFPRTGQSFPAGRRSESFFGTPLPCHPLGNPFAFEVWLTRSLAVGGWHGRDCGDAEGVIGGGASFCRRQDTGRAGGAADTGDTAGA